LCGSLGSICCGGAGLGRVFDWVLGVAGPRLYFLVWRGLLFGVTCWVTGMGYVTVSAKIPRELKRLLERYGIRPGPIIREALEEAVKRRMAEELEERARRIGSRAGGIKDEEVAGSIREDRDR